MVVRFSLSDGHLNGATRTASALFSAVLALFACTGASPEPDGGAAISDGGSSSGAISDAGAPDTAPATTPIDDVFIEPRDGAGFLLDAIRNATSSVDFAMYILTDNGVEDALIAAHRRGVAVRVILDLDVTVNNTAKGRLETAGVVVRAGPSRFTNFHVKTALVDGQAAYIMTLNASYSAFNDNREYALKVTRAAELQDLTAIFNADWDNASSPSIQSALVVSPNNSRQRLLALIGLAREDILVTVETFADTNIRAALRARSQAGVQVRVLLAHPSAVDQNTADAADLRADGFQVRFLLNPTLHAKLIIVDGRIAYAGSINLTRTSLDQNREVGVLIDAPSTVAELDAQAEADWNAGS